MSEKEANKDKDTKKVYISLPFEVWESLEGLAREQGRTTSNLGAYAIEHFLGFVAPKIYPLSRAIERYRFDEGDID